MKVNTKNDQQELDQVQEKSYAAGNLEEDVGSSSQQASNAARSNIALRHRPYQLYFRKPIRIHSSKLQKRTPFTP